MGLGPENKNILILFSFCFCFMKCCIFLVKSCNSCVMLQLLKTFFERVHFFKGCILIYKYSFQISFISVLNLYTKTLYSLKGEEKY